MPGACLTISAKECRPAGTFSSSSVVKLEENPDFFTSMIGASAVTVTSSSMVAGFMETLRVTVVFIMTLIFCLSTL